MTAASFLLLASDLRNALTIDLVAMVITSSQFYLAILGVTAVALSQSRYAKYRKWSSVFGLMGQPFWFHATYTGQQWGIFAVCFVYSAVWCKGFYNNWLASPEPEE